MPRLQYKSFATPDEHRNFPNGQAEVVGLDDSSVGRAVFEPGWHWSTDMALIVGTESCQLRLTRSGREVGLPIRAGVHTGEVELSGTDARGLAVHTAARVMGLAEADEVLVSTTTAALLEGSGLMLEDAGMHEMKGLPGARQLLRLVRSP